MFNDAAEGEDGGGVGGVGGVGGGRGEGEPVGEPVAVGRISSQSSASEMVSKSQATISCST